MLSFLGSIVGKIASAVASVFVAVGLLSAPASVNPQPMEQPVIVETSTTTATAEIQEETSKEVEIDVKAELDALKKQLADEQKKRKDLEKKITAPSIKPTPTPQTISVVIPPVVTPAPIPVVAAPTQTTAPSSPTLLPGQFMLPSGAIVDSTGKIVKEAPISSTPVNQPVVATTTTTTPPPPPAPVWPPAEGSTVNIQRSVLSIINFNPQLTCDQLLSLPLNKKDLCELYKNNTANGKYTWNIIEDL